MPWNAASKWGPVTGEWGPSPAPGTQHRELCFFQSQTWYNRAGFGTLSTPDSLSLTSVLDQALQLAMQDWKYFNGNVYFFSRDKKSWHEAEKFCMSQGAHLASVTSQEEQVRAGGVGQAESGVWLGTQKL